MPPTSLDKHPHLLTALVMAVVAALAMIVSRASAADAIWYPLFGANAGVSPVDPPALQFVWPTVGQAVAFGPAWVAGIGVVLLAFALARHLGCSPLAAAATALALSFSGSFWAWTSMEQPITHAVLFSLGATGGLLVWRESRRRSVLVASAISYALAVAGHPAALGALPALVWAAGYGGLLPVAATTAGAALGAAGLWWTFGGASSLGDWFLRDPFAVIGDRVGDMSGQFLADFGLLGIALLGLGLVRLAARFDRLVLLAGWAAGVSAWALLRGAPDWQGSLLLAFAPLWLVMAAGIEWVHSLAKTRGARLGAVGITLLLPAMNLAAHFETGARARSASAFTDRYLDQLAEVIPVDAVILAEGGLLGRRMADRASRQPDSVFDRMPQTPSNVMHALWESRPVVAFDGARENLRALGFRFETIGAAGVPMQVGEFLDSVPKGWIVATAAGPEFLRSVQPNEGATFGAIGGSEDLFGRLRQHYGLIGVKGSKAAFLERTDLTGVDVSVSAGQSLDRYVRAPVAVRVRSRQNDAVIEYRGEVVASTGPGIALAVISPSGNLEAVYDSGFSPGHALLVNPPALRPGLVTGREPCVEARPGRWTDMSHIAASSSLGALKTGGQHLTLYVAADHPLTPRHHRLRRQRPLALDVTPFDTASTSDFAALRDLLRNDGLDTVAPGLADQAYVYRIRTRAPRNGRRQLALRLGGFATRAFARVDNAVGEPLHLCAAMKAAVGRGVNLDRDDLFVFGWDGVESLGPTPFRWTTASRAELLLPMSQAEDATVAIDAWPMAGAGTTLTLRVNDAEFSPVVLEAATNEYRWEVPAESWRTGMNRVYLEVSGVVRPSDLGGGDERLLGLAVQRIRLISASTEPAASAGRR